MRIKLDVQNAKLYGFLFCLMFSSISLFAVSWSDGLVAYPSDSNKIKSHKGIVLGYGSFGLQTGVAWNDNLQPCVGIVFSKKNVCDAYNGEYYRIISAYSIAHSILYQGDFNKRNAVLYSFWYHNHIFTPISFGSSFMVSIYQNTVSCDLSPRVGIIIPRLQRDRGRNLVLNFINLTRGDTYSFKLDYGYNLHLIGNSQNQSPHTFSLTIYWNPTTGGARLH